MNPGLGSEAAIALAAMARALGATSTSTDNLLEKTSSENIASATIHHRLSRLVVNSKHQLPLDPEDMERVTTDALAHTHAAFRLVVHTAQVSEILRSETIDFLVIKGVALAALSQTPAGRGAGDVDILVAPTDVPRVHQIFLAHGFRPALALPDVKKRQTWGVWSFLDREATYVGGSAPIDLHWRISSQHHLFPSFAELHSRKTEITVADATLPTLSLADSLAASCYHAYFDQFQPLRSLLDVVSVVKAAKGITLPSYSVKLQRLMAGVLELTRSLFQGLVDDDITSLLTSYPAPPSIVRKRFDEALSSPKIAWEESQDTAALWAKMLAEGPFDRPIELLPRFIGKRLFHFPPWSESAPHTTLTRAFTQRIRVEARRRKRP
jgi:hypothetical protein